ncbi:Dolichyl-phosphate-mannose-mannosyltransferase family protein [Sinomonas atrocyanea]|uniref:Dolichyl-phosphate-mannose-mannosyltransferase family protein n=1 Tax=Sinomonas atrocyanea TaxID=37927 RepID=A0A127A2U5_9MICC|nr:glycosyltransferase family 39 protein [Sinomonas atrocyanea]AMM33623.1 Dolichyl-phosphate-mannose-mannosyltransferase family protein [Sinomonas atrocyanea]GEB63293.1 glycosyl transferase [Sinomonas atrocyanea]GGG53049.1 glycosyl transferase [Sinomonas atrocyanea]
MIALDAVPAKASTKRTLGRERWETAGLLAGTAVLYLWNLGINGWANAFYTAAAYSGADNVTAFFFGSSDPANAISVDKPPLALWVMSLSVKAFGLNSWSLLAPEALMGVGTVWLIYRMAAHYLGHRWGLLAGALMALMPAATAVFRYNNPDALLTLLMTAAAAATLRAIRTGRQRHLALAGILLGAGFLTKQLQVALVVPALLVAVIGLGSGPRGRRMRGAALAAGAALGTAGAWLAVLALTPAASRPFIGGTRTNSFWELTFGYNGLDRLTGLDAERAQVFASVDKAELPTGPLRFLTPQMSGQIVWVLPLALAGILMAAFLWRSAPAHSRAFLAVNVLWFVCSITVVAFMSGIVHGYYVMPAIPPAACLAALALKKLVERRASLRYRSLLAGSLALTLLLDYVVAIQGANSFPWFPPIVLVTGSLASVLAILPPRRNTAVPGMALTLSLILLGPTLWSGFTVGTAHEGAGLAGGPAVGGHRPDDPSSSPMQSQDEPQLDALKFGDFIEPSAVEAVTREPSDVTWAAAVIGSSSAAKYEIAARRSVLALGGFDGTDPSPTLEDFKNRVTSGEIGQLIVGTVPPATTLGLGEAARILAWVQANYTCRPAGHACLYRLGGPPA